MRSFVSHSIQRPPFEDLENGLPSSDYVGIPIWLKSYPNLDRSVIRHSCRRFGIYQPQATPHESRVTKRSDAYGLLSESQYYFIPSSFLLVQFQI